VPVLQYPRLVAENQALFREFAPLSRNGTRIEAQNFEVIFQVPIRHRSMMLNTPQKLRGQFPTFFWRRFHMPKALSKNWVTFQTIFIANT
jgi:hypothetical protein